MLSGIDRDKIWNNANIRNGRAASNVLITRWGEIINYGVSSTFSEPIFGESVGRTVMLKILPHEAPLCRSRSGEQPSFKNDKKHICRVLEF
jgi:hypothetical protein